jgi:hypothetical protein
MAFAFIWSSPCGLALQLCIQDLVHISVLSLEMCGSIEEEFSDPVKSSSIVQQH